MTRHDFVTKWIIYAVAFLPIWFLENYVLNRFPLFGVVPMLMPVAVVTVAVLEGGPAGGTFGLCVGVLCDAVYGTGGAMTLGLTLIGTGAGITAQYLLRQNLPGCILCALGGLAAMDACRIVWRLVAGVAPLGPMLRVAGAEILWSLVFVAPIYGIFHWVHGRTQFATLF